MGIKDHNKLLKEEGIVNAFIEVPISLFSGRRVAVDLSITMKANISVATKMVLQKTDLATGKPDSKEISDIWLSLMLNKIAKFLKYQIVPIIVHDGPDVPAEKEMARSKRREKREKCKAEIDDEWEKISEGNIMSIDTTKLEKLLINNSYVTREDRRRFDTTLKTVGIPVIQATGEAEYTCACLVLEGKASAVFSTDTDTLTHGCPFVITDYHSADKYWPQINNREPGFKVAILSEILNGLGINFEQYVDLCITLQCDYNKRVKGLGMKTAIKLIRKYGFIDNFPEKIPRISGKADLMPLAHHRCRELFKRVDSSSIIHGDISPLDINVDSLLKAREILESLGTDYWIRDLAKCYENFRNIIPQDHVDLPYQKYLMIDKNPKQVTNEKIEILDILAMDFNGSKTVNNTKNSENEIIDILDISADLPSTSKIPDVSANTGKNPMILPDVPQIPDIL